MARILLIDDSPLQQLCMTRVLQALSHEVTCHADPGDAIRKSKPDTIDVVLVELLLRRGNGFETGLQLREAGYSRVLLLTAVYRETDEIWAQALGICGVITRPLPPERLQERIATTMMQQIAMR